MENLGHPIKNIENPYSKLEQKYNVPIVDVIRHGETKRKQDFASFHDASLLDVDNSGFKLDAEHLDLDDKGIAGIEVTANQLADLINKEKEVILIVSSPAWRTHSSALVLEKVLRERGVNILTEEKKLKFFKEINQNSSFFEKIIKRDFGDNEQTKEVIKDYKEKGYKEGFKSAEKILGVNREEIEKKMDEAETSSFQKFLRHITNIHHWLNPETIASLKGKKLRIVVFAHEETTRGFIEKNMPSGTTSQEKGQILEITP